MKFVQLPFQCTDSHRVTWHIFSLLHAGSHRNSWLHLQDQRRAGRVLWGFTDLEIYTPDRDEHQRCIYKHAEAGNLQYSVLNVSEHHTAKTTLGGEWVHWPSLSCNYLIFLTTGVSNFQKVPSLKTFKIQNQSWHKAECVSCKQENVTLRRGVPSHRDQLVRVGEVRGMADWRRRRNNGN